MTVEKTNTGFSAFSQNYPIFTTGQSISELINNSYEREITNNARYDRSHESIKIDL